MQTDCQPNAMSLSTDSGIDVSRVKRDHGLHRAAQLLADATRIRRGDAPRPLVQLEPKERAWCKQMARTLIEVFETITVDREPDAVTERREAEAAEKVTRYARTLESRLLIERTKATVAAADRGHVLTTWRPRIVRDIDGEEQAHCTRCTRLAYISLGSEPVLSGTALSEGCLTAAPDGGRS